MWFAMGIAVVLTIEGQGDLVHVSLVMEMQELTEKGAVNSSGDVLYLSLCSRAASQLPARQEVCQGCSGRSIL